MNYQRSQAPKNYQYHTRKMAILIIKYINLLNIYIYISINKKMANTLHVIPNNNHLQSNFALLKF